MSAADQPRAGDWSSAEYVRRWTEGDALGDVLALPRRMSAALVLDAGIHVRRVADLGAGSGSYLAVLLEAFPEASGTWIDASEPMLERARVALEPFGDRVAFELVDARGAEALPLDEPDVVVTSRVIHHFDAPTIRAVYARIRAATQPGGFFFNLDHVHPPGGWDPGYRRVRETLVPRPRTTERHPHDAPPQALADHLAWLDAAGFEEVDAPWRFLLTALMVGRVPGGP